MKTVLSTRELFAGWGVELDEAPASAIDADSGVCAVVEVSSDCLDGAIGIELSDDFVALLPPIDGCTGRHWAKELVNQLTGRLRNALLLDGIDVDMSVPTSLHFARVNIPQRDWGAFEVKYTSAGAGLRVFMEFDAPDSLFEVASSHAPNTRTHAQGESQLLEGEAIFF